MWRGGGVIGYIGLMGRVGDMGGGAVVMAAER